MQKVSNFTSNVHKLLVAPIRWSHEESLLLTHTKPKFRIFRCYPWWRRKWIWYLSSKSDFLNRNRNDWFYYNTRSKQTSCETISKCGVFLGIEIGAVKRSLNSELTHGGSRAHPRWIQSSSTAIHELKHDWFHYKLWSHHHTHRSSLDFFLKLSVLGFEYLRKYNWVRKKRWTCQVW